MQEKLFIYLHIHDLSQPSWATGSFSHRGDLSQLAAAAKERDVVVIVPATDVLLLSTQMPKMPRARMLQALPFALEEQLVADVETLHFAVADVDDQGQLPVAIVAHEKMQQWLALLQSWHIKPGKLIPAVFALPVQENAWQVWVSDEVIVRYGAYEGFGCDRDNLGDFLRLMLDSASSLPQSIQVHNYSKQAIAATIKLITPLHETSSEQPQLVTDVASQGIQLPYINLLQGQYTSKKARLPKWQLGWKVAAILGVAWVAALFIKPLLSILLLGQQLHSLNKDMAAIYNRHFPQSTSVVAPKLRMQEKWQHLAAAAGENQALLQLGVIGKAMSQAKSITIKRFDYQAGDTTVELSAASSEDFSAFTDYLTANGMNIKQQNANLLEGRISATIQITAS